MSPCSKGYLLSQSLKTFEQVGRAIAEIRDRKLYVEEYGTFDEYMRKRWGWSARRGYQLIEASSIDAKSSSRFDLTANAAEHLAKVTILVAAYPENDRSRAIAGNGEDCKRRFYALNQTISTDTLTSLAVNPKAPCFKMLIVSHHPGFITKGNEGNPCYHQHTYQK